MDGTSDDGRWLTYAELADLRGISKASATRMSFRRKWRRQAGNDGTVRVLVPPSALHDKLNGSDMVGMAAAIEAVTVAFREEVEHERGRADRAEQALARAETARDGERNRADALRDRLEASKAELQQAKNVADALRQANAARKARGRLARLRAAWRGE